MTLQILYDMEIVVLLCILSVYLKQQCENNLCVNSKKISFNINVRYKIAQKKQNWK